MAEGKKGFLLYADYIHTLRLLTDVQRGQLMLTIFEYVNDLNPDLNDPVLKVVFEPIKQQLKRDLRKYKGKIIQCSNAGKASAEARKKKKQRALTNVNKRQRSSTDSTVNDNDNDNVKDNKNIPTFEEFKNYVHENDSSVTIQAIKLKYNAWKENNWKDGNHKPIKNWKSKILNTIPHLEKNKEQKQTINKKWEQSRNI